MENIAIKLYVRLDDGCLYENSNEDDYSFELDDGYLTVDNIYDRDTEFYINDGFVIAETAEIQPDNTFRFGNPLMFVMGAEQTIRDPFTGNILGYDNVGVNAAIDYTFQLLEIAGGMQNRVVGYIPHSARLTGSYTSQAFSLSQKALFAGQRVESNAVVPVCETIRATGTTLVVSNVPSKALAQPESDEYAWCQVCVHGAKSFEGVNYGVDIATREVQDFTAMPNISYDVYYFKKSPSAKMFGLPDTLDLPVLSIELKMPVYCQQTNAKNQSILQGHLYIVIPRAVPTGDVSIDSSNIENVKSTYTWNAVTDGENIPPCEDCYFNSSYLGYYVYVPCATDYEDVEQVIIVGDEMTIPQFTEQRIPIVLLYNDGTTRTPNYRDLIFISSNPSVASLNANGYVHGNNIGDATITVSLKKGDGTVLSDYTSVEVTYNAEAEAKSAMLSVRRSLQDNATAEIMQAIEDGTIDGDKIDEILVKWFGSSDGKWSEGIKGVLNEAIASADKYTETDGDVIKAREELNALQEVNK